MFNDDEPNAPEWNDEERRLLTAAAFASDVMVMTQHKVLMMHAEVEALSLLWELPSPATAPPEASS